VVVVGETWLSDDIKSLFGTAGFNSEFNCRTDRIAGGVAIFV
jgi:hypothetical protein